jgi:hypothetical protein
MPSYYPLHVSYHLLFDSQVGGTGASVALSNSTTFPQSRARLTRSPACSSSSSTSSAHHHRPPPECSLRSSKLIRPSRPLPSDRRLFQAYSPNRITSSGFSVSFALAIACSRLSSTSTDADIALQIYRRRVASSGTMTQPSTGDAPAISSASHRYSVCRLSSLGSL